MNKEVRKMFSFDIEDFMFERVRWSEQTVASKSFSVRIKGMILLFHVWNVII